MDFADIWNTGPKDYYILLNKRLLMIITHFRIRQDIKSLRHFPSEIQLNADTGES